MGTSTWRPKTAPTAPQLWRIDGTTRAATALTTLPASGVLAHRQVTDLVRFDGRVWFRADDGTHGRELWASDGTAGGTQVFLDLVPGSGSSDPLALTPIGDRLYFGADTGLDDAVPWVTDGTVLGSHALLAGTTETYSEPESFTTAGGRVYYRQVAEGGPSRLWRTDGTAAGTAPVSGVLGAAGGGEQIVCEEILGVAGGGQLVFASRPGPTTGVEPYVVDATTLATTLLANIAFSTTRTRDADVGNLLRHDGQVLFTVTTPGAGNELWTTDGTEAGTRLLADIQPGPGGSSPAQLVPVRRSRLVRRRRRRARPPALADRRHRGRHGEDERHLRQRAVPLPRWADGVRRPPLLRRRRRPGGP